MVSHGLTFKWGACVLHFPQHDHKHVQAVLKFQSPYFNWETDPILQFFPHKHTYKIILRKHLETLLLFTHTWQFQSTSTITSPHKLHKYMPQREPILWVHYHFCFLFLYFWLWVWLYNFFWTKATLHLAFTSFPDEAAALSLSSLSPSSTSNHPRSFSFVPHASDVHHACQVRCSSGKPTPVTLHSHCFQTYMYMYHSSQSHHKIPHLSNHILTCSWKLPKCFVWPQIILHSSRSYK